jgi:hypothetical protein
LCENVILLLIIISMFVPTKLNRENYQMINPLKCSIYRVFTGVSGDGRNFLQLESRSFFFITI